MARSANRMKEMRDRKGLSLRALAEEVGADHGYLGKMERGASDLSLSWMRRIARVLDCSVANLLLPEDLKPTKSARAASRDPFPRLSSPQSAPSWPITIVDDNEFWSPRGCIHFGQEYLDTYKVNPMHCLVVGTGDDSMAPRLPFASVCVIDRDKTELYDGALYGIEHNGQTLIRWAVKKGAEFVFQATDTTKPVLTLAEVKLIGFVLWGGWNGPAADRWKRSVPRPVRKLA